MSKKCPRVIEMIGGKPEHTVSFKVLKINMNRNCRWRL